jgi:phosphoribosylamine--glycine ligase
VIGSGAREHTLVWKLSQSPRVNELFVAPGNAGTAQLAQNLNTRVEDIDELVKFAVGNRIDLTVVGPEAPLAAGIADRFIASKIAIFGPTKAAAEIESSKVFAKELMQRHGIPCARSASFSNYDQARAYVEKQEPPIVIKVDGLAAGKGVIITESVPEAQEALSNIMETKSFGAAGNRVVIEEHLYGRELSFFVFSDGQTIMPTIPACDYKRAFDGDKGSNTGGMGSYSPPPFFSRALADIITGTIMQPAVLAMKDENRMYKGVLYGGLIITNRVPKVIEFNARLGDPETQVVLPRLKTDLVDIMMAVVDNTLGEINMEWSDDACVGVVMASGGYPGSYKTGYPVDGLDDVDSDIMVFHAGTRLNPEGQVLTSGGRVLTVVATGKDLKEARDKVYNNIKRITFEGCRYRTDIADSI